jgi:hypothetical protein
MLIVREARTAIRTAVEVGRHCYDRHCVGIFSHHRWVRILLVGHSRPHHIVCRVRDPYYLVDNAVWPALV